MSNIGEIVNTAPAKETNPLFELLGQIKADLTGSTLVESVVEAFRKKNIDEKKQKMAEQLASAVQNYTALDRAFKAIKPTPSGFDADGKVVSEIYSKAQIEERKKLKESLEKAVKIISQGLTTGDFSQFGNIKGPVGGKDAASTDESA